MKKIWWIILAVSAVITVIGLVTGRFFFLLLILPLGFFGWGRRNNTKD